VVQKGTSRFDSTLPRAGEQKNPPRYTAFSQDNCAGRRGAPPREWYNFAAHTP